MITSILLAATLVGGNPPAGQRVFTCGHSFHFFMPAILEEIAHEAGITNHQTVGLSAIGGAPMNTHWLVPDDKSEAKAALRAGKVDVLTLSPMWLPDPGIEHFAKLALQSNPNVRITLQEFWLPNDEYDPVYPVKVTKPVDHNAPSIAELRQRHAPYFKAIDAEVVRLNRGLSKPAVFAVPVGQAVLALREKVPAGEVPGVKTQADLFTDKVGHPKPPVQLLEAYCHFAVIYRTSPVGLPAPGRCPNDEQLFQRGLWTLDVGKPVLNRYKEADKLNRLLQELAWDAVTHHPLSGIVSHTSPPTSGMTTLPVPPSRR